MSAMRSKMSSTAMSTVAGHRGVAEDEPRNRGPIAYFKPKKVTEESARELLTRSLPRASAAQIEMRVQQVMRRIAIGPIKPPAPLSQSLEEVDDPHYGLGTHPDIIEHIWKLDASLPQRCQWGASYHGLISNRKAWRRRCLPPGSRSGWSPGRTRSNGCRRAAKSDN
jgi:hypothetical protein